MSTLRWQSELDARIAQYSSQTGFATGWRGAGCAAVGRVSTVPSGAHPRARRGARERGAGEEFGKALGGALCQRGAAQAFGQREDSGDRRGYSPTSANYGRCGAPRSGAGAEFAHPEWMVARWIDMYGYNAARAICAADQQAPAAALRLVHARCGGRTARGGNTDCAGSAADERAAIGLRRPGAQHSRFAIITWRCRTKPRNWWPRWWEKASEYWIAARRREERRRRLRRAIRGRRSPRWNCTNIAQER